MDKVVIPGSIFLSVILFFAAPVFFGVMVLLLVALPTALQYASNKLGREDVEAFGILPPITAIVLAVLSLVYVFTVNDEAFTPGPNGMEPIAFILWPIVLGIAGVASTMHLSGK